MSVCGVGVSVFLLAAPVCFDDDEEVVGSGHTALLDRSYQPPEASCLPGTYGSNQ